MTYEYECNKCGTVFEVQRVRVKDRDTIKCPDCGESCKRRCVYSLGTIYRVRGFYETDYKRKNT